MAKAKPAAKAAKNDKKSDKHSKKPAKVAPKGGTVKASAKQQGASKAGKPAAKDAKPAKKATVAAPKAGKKSADQPPASKAAATKAATPAVAKVAKKAGKADTKGKGKGKKVDDDLDDSFLDADVDGSDIEEYAEELEAVEEMDEEAAKEEEAVDLTGETKPADNDEEIYLTDAEGNRYCRSKDCDQIAAVEGYCRYHYLLFWKKIQVRKKILQDGKLERYVEELTSRYPDKFLEVIRKDLRSLKDFQAAIHELEIDDSGMENEFEDDAQSFADEIRGMSENVGTGMEEEEF